jgi:hypothetical protein
MDENHNTRLILKELYQDLKQVKPTDTQEQRVVSGVMDHIETTLDPATTSAEHHETLIERLREAVYHLEGQHPALARAMNTVIDTLSNMGL